MINTNNPGLKVDRGFNFSCIEILRLVNVKTGRHKIETEYLTERNGVARLFQRRRGEGGVTPRVLAWSTADVLS